MNTKSNAVDNDFTEVKHYVTTLSKGVMTASNK